MSFLHAAFIIASPPGYSACDMAALDAEDRLIETLTTRYPEASDEEITVALHAGKAEFAVRCDIDAAIKAALAKMGETR